MKHRAIMLVFALILVLLAFSQPACVLITEGIYVHRVYNNYVCRATLMDANNGERRTLVSSMLSNSAPGAASHSFFSHDWDGNGVYDEQDVLLDWRRYLRNDVVTSSRFAGRTWCIRPAETSCMQSGRVAFNLPFTPTPLPAAEVANCSEGTLAQLEVSAPGLTSDNQFAFPDVPVGNVGPATTFTVTNRSAVPLRVNAINFIAGGDVPDFVKSSDNCVPTAAEMAAGRGYLLPPSGACTFQLQFGPQHRDGVPECAAGAPNESCRRRASLFVTGEIDASRSALAPVNVGVSGRAIGGGISTEPAEICFAAAPALGTCTPFQTLRIRNTSSGDLVLTSARLTRAGNRFEATMPFLMPLTLPMGLPVDVPVRFCNVANDPTDGEFTINSSSPTNPTTVVSLVNPLNRRCP